MKSNNLTLSRPISYYCAVKYQDAAYMTREFTAALEEKNSCLVPQLHKRYHLGSSTFKILFLSLNLARGVIWVPLLSKCHFWVPELGFGCHWVPELGFECHSGPNGSKPVAVADVARSYTWGPYVSWLYLYLFLFWGTVDTISRIFQKLYLFHTISDEDDFYIKIVALDEIYDFLVLSFLI
jgi:hypothetical protein